MTSTFLVITLSTDRSLRYRGIAQLLSMQGLAAAAGVGPGVRRLSYHTTRMPPRSSP